jgi:hypothetical protein
MRRRHVIALLLWRPHCGGLRAGERLTGSWTLDDPDYVLANPHVLSGLSARGVAWAFTTGHAGNWIPLTWLSHMLDVELYGREPGGHHVTSLVLHVLNTLLLFAALIRWTGAEWRSAFVAGAFALHPLHVESVAWLAERKDVLSTTFWMLALLAYTRYAREPIDRRRFGLVVLMLVLGLMCKPHAGQPARGVLLLLDLLARSARTQSGRGRVSCARRSAVRRGRGLGRGDARGAASAPGRSRRSRRSRSRSGSAIAIRASLAYLLDTVWPFRPVLLLSLSGGKRARPDHAPRAAVPRGRHGGRDAVTRAVPVGRATGWLWYLVTLLPVIGLIQVGMLSRADRYYLRAADRHLPPDRVAGSGARDPAPPRTHRGPGARARRDARARLGLPTPRSGCGRTASRSTRTPSRWTRRTGSRTGNLGSVL